MGLWRSVWPLALCGMVGVGAALALDDYGTRLGLARRQRKSLLDRADLDRLYAHNAPLPPVTGRVRFGRPLRVRAASGGEERLDFSRGKHIVLFAGCT